MASKMTLDHAGLPQKESGEPKCLGAGQEIEKLEKNQIRNNPLSF
jgi:hypothetical protein